MYLSTNLLSSTVEILRTENFYYTFSSYSSCYCYVQLLLSVISCNLIHDVMTRVATCPHNPRAEPCGRVNRDTKYAPRIASLLPILTVIRINAGRA